MPEIRLQVIKGLEDVEVDECESCTFGVTLNLAYIEGVWTRNGTQLKSKPNCRISMHGKKHSLILNRVALGDAGLFSFEANGIQTSGKLTVKGKGADCWAADMATIDPSAFTLRSHQIQVKAENPSIYPVCVTQLKSGLIIKTTTAMTVEEHQITDLFSLVFLTEFVIIV